MFVPILTDEPLLRAPAVNGGRGGAPWASVHVALVAPEGWTRGEVEAGLRELERVRRETDAASALLCGALPDDRDTVAAIARISGLSTREARKRRDIAAVARVMPSALAMLSLGAVSGEHVAALGPVAGKPGAETLLAGAGAIAPEELTRGVEQLRLAGEHGPDAARAQHAQRLLRFFAGPDGMIGMTGQFTPIEGTTLKTMLAALVNARWRAAHPDRAEVLGAHGGDTNAQRMADALLDVAGVPRCTPEGPPTAGPDPTTTVPPEASAESAETAVDPVDAPEGSITRVHTAKPAVIIVFDIDAWHARIAGHGPVPITTSLFDRTRNDLYFHFRNTRGEVLKFGHARRHPTTIQRLAIIARDQHCLYPGCHAPPDHCQIHHFDEVDQDHGTTDIDVLGLFCKPHHHHQHLHRRNLIVTREPDGTIAIRERATGVIVAQSTVFDRP